MFHHIATSAATTRCESRRSPHPHHLRELGYERRAVDAVFRALPVVVFPGYSRPLVRVSDYLALLDRSCYDGRTRVR
jgi:hypothetical protein